MRFLIEQIALPIATRAGAMTAGALVGVGLAAEHAVTVESAVVAVLLLCVDLASRKLVAMR